MTLWRPTDGRPIFRQEMPGRGQRAKEERGRHLLGPACFRCWTGVVSNSNLSTTGSNFRNQPSFLTIKRLTETNGGGLQQATECTIAYRSIGRSRVTACVVDQQDVQGATSAMGETGSVSCCGEIDEIDGSARRTAAGNGSTNILCFPSKI